MIKIIVAFLLLTTGNSIQSESGIRKSEETGGVTFATKCEVCKVLSAELQSRLDNTGRVNDVIETGYSLDELRPRKKTSYNKSELRLTEVMDDVCEEMLQYKIHKEKTEGTRYSKGTPVTFQTLNSLVAKGVKVDLGIPQELWDKPSAEITHLKTQCEHLMEENEEVLEKWYWEYQDKVDLNTYFCIKNVLKDQDDSCLFVKDLKGESVQRSNDL